jgi:hypothetical protein
MPTRAWLVHTRRHARQASLLRARPWTCSLCGRASRVDLRPYVRPPLRPCALALLPHYPMPRRPVSHRSVPQELEPPATRRAPIAPARPVPAGRAPVADTQATQPPTPDEQARGLLKLLHLESGHSYQELGAMLARRDAAGAERAPLTRMRLADWTAGRRPIPEWVTRAAAAELCQMWAHERRSLLQGSAASASDLQRCDARWARRLDPAVAAFLDCTSGLPEEVRAALKPLEAALLTAFVQRYGCLPPAPGA